MASAELDKSDAPVVGTSSTDLENADSSAVPKTVAGDAPIDQPVVELAAWKFWLILVALCLTVLCMALVRLAKRYSLRWLLT